MKKRYYWLIIILIGSILGIIQTSFSFQNEEHLEQNWEGEQQKNNNFLKIHYLDVGQGDAIFIELPNQQNLLIDGAESKEKEKIIDYINRLNKQKN